jgi:molybdopterin-guanine dinucleotide biosynthesis protein A
MQPASVTLAVLAGGIGSRMGTPKANLVIQDQPILQWILDRIRWPGPTLLVTAPGVTHPPGWQRFDRHAIDPVSGQGPLRGILTAIEHCSTDKIAVTTVDMPGVSIEMLWDLVRAMDDRNVPSNAALQHAPIDAIMYERTLGGRRQVEPFPSVYRSQARQFIQTRLDAGLMSVHSLCDDPRYATIPAPVDPAPHCWANLNTPKDFSEFEKSIG